MGFVLWLRYEGVVEVLDFVVEFEDLRIGDLFLAGESRYLPTPFLRHRY